MRYAALRAAAVASAAAYRAEQRIGPLAGAIAGFACGSLMLAYHCARNSTVVTDVPLTDSIPAVVVSTAIFSFGGLLYRQASDRHVRDVRAEGETPALERIAEELNHRAERARFWDAYRQ